MYFSLAGILLALAGNSAPIYEDAAIQFRINGRIERTPDLSQDAKTFFKDIRDAIPTVYGPLAAEKNTITKAVIIHHLVNPLKPDEEFKLYARPLDEGQSVPSGKYKALPYWILADDEFTLKFQSLAEMEGKVNVEIYVGEALVWEGETKCPIANGPLGVNLNKVVMQENGVLRWGFVSWDADDEGRISCMETDDIDLWDLKEKPGSIVEAANEHDGKFGWMKLEVLAILLIFVGLIFAFLILYGFHAGGFRASRKATEYVKVPIMERKETSDGGSEGEVEEAEAELVALVANKAK
jgi:hypothetical protein